MAAEIHVGCSGFQKSQAEYFKRFRLVEIQQTFYRPPLVKTAERWRLSAPRGFIFAIKAWQLITHEPWSPTYRRTGLDITAVEWADYGSFRPTVPVLSAWERTREFACALDAKIVLFQCPRQFTPTPSHVGNMRSFFEKINRSGLQFVWEPRGIWPDEVVRSLCRELDLIHAVDPFITQQQSGGSGYYRMHGGPDYRHQHSDTELAQLKSWCQHREIVFCLFNNVTMWDDASRFLEMIQEDNER
jgi:uncharacterized protein YecE (DUF72 family)